MEIWESMACPLKSCYELNCLQCQKMPFQKIGEMEVVEYEGQFFAPPPGPHG